MNSSSHITRPLSGIILMGAALLILGILVIAGWYLGNLHLIQIYPTFAPMQYNTALGFAFSGLSILALASKRYNEAGLCGFVVCALGAITLMQYILAIDFGIDELFIDHYVTTKTSHPGRMAPNTALCFSLAGVALLSMARPHITLRQHFMQRALGTLVAALGGIALISYIADLETGYGWSNLTRMAAHTAIGFVILGTGLLIHAHNVGIQQNAGAKYWFAILTATFMLIFTLVLWEEVRKQETRLIDGIVREEVKTIRQSIIDNISHSVIALRRMAQRWEARGGTPKTQWQSDAKNYVDDQAALTTVQWVDPDYYVRWIEPLKGNEPALGLNIVFNEERKKALEGAKQKNTVTLTPPLDLVQGYRAFIAYAPIHINKKFGGFIVGIYDVDATLNHVLPFRFKDSFNIRIVDGETPVYSWVDEAYEQKKIYTVTEKLELFNREWTIDIWPKKKAIEEHASSLPDIVLLAGSLISLLSGIAIYYAISAHHKNKLLIQKTQALEDSEELYRVIVESVDGIILMNGSGVIEKVNRSAEQIFGYTQAELAGKNIAMLLPGIATEDEKKPLTCLHEEMVGARKKTGNLPIDVSVYEITLSDRVLYSAIVDDISERKEAENERARLVEKLTESNTELERFAYVASHDMQEPLRMVTSFSSLLLEEHKKDLNEEAQEYLDLVIDAGSRMQAMIADLLEYSRMSHESKEPVLVNAKQELEHVLENLQRYIAERGADITYDDLPEFYGNPIQFMRLLQNLITNAIKYQPKDSKPVVHVGVADLQTHWEFSVKDNGLGIKKQFVDEIFSPFRRLHSWESISGTGLGLAICRKIVENHGGLIRVESTPGKGSVFYFTIVKNTIQT